MRAVLFAMVAVILAACGPYNTGLNTVQVSAETLPFPENYQVEAARVAATRPQAIGTSILVSQPRPTLGVNPLSPQRWFVCVRGLAAPEQAKPSLPPLDRLAGQLIDLAAYSGHHDLVLIFSGTARPTVLEGTDSALCRAAVFEPLMATAPLA